MQELYLERQQHTPSGPGLTALVVYLRPSARTPLLSALSAFGIMVVESLGESWERAWSLGPADLGVVVADDSREHLRIFAEMASSTAAPILALTRSNTEFSAFEHAGAWACAAEASEPQDFHEPLKNVAREARRKQERISSRGLTAWAGLTVFDDIQFQLNPPCLVRNTRSVALSALECDALQALSEQMGRPVANTAMEKRLARRSGPVSAGYIKTIVLRLRRKVDLIGGDSAVLAAVRGFGYVLRS